MKHKRFIKNAAILTGTSLVLRTVGIFFRIWLAAAVGAEGMGLYQLIFSVFMLAATFASAGITTAVTRMIAELPSLGGSCIKIVRRAVQMSLLAAFLTAGVLILAAAPITDMFICDSRALLSVRLMGLALPFMGVSSCIKGYFFATGNTAVPSCAQLIEQAARMAFILPAVHRFSGLGLEYSLAAIMVGDAAAEGVSCLYSYCLYLKHTKDIRKDTGSSIAVTKKMLHISVPITAGRYLQTLLRTTENLLVPAFMAEYTGNRAESLSIFGKLKGMVMPLLFFPASFLTAFSTLVIPEISRAVSLGHFGKVQSACRSAIGFVVNVSMPIAAVFFLCGNQISDLFYPKENAGFLVRALAPLVPFMYLESVCDGILKGLDQQTHSFLYGVLDAASRIALIILFVGKRGISAFLLIMVYSNLLTSLLNFRRLLKVTKTKFMLLEWLFKPLMFSAAAVLLGGAAIKNVTGNLPVAAVGAFTVTAVYCILTVIFSSEETNFLSLRSDEK